MKYLLLWPLANIRHNPWLSGFSVVAVALSVFAATTLLGFVSGYERAVERDVDRMGFDLLITAKGCPYEAATLMLRGGVGLRYMPDGVVERLRADERVAAVHPTLIHPLRDPSTAAGMVLLQGTSRSLKDAQGLTLREGSWLTGDGVVLGFEAAELEQRHAGDPYLLPGGEATVVQGVLERTGSQLDGTVLMDLAEVQRRFGLPGRLTGVGVQVRPERRGELDALRDTWNAEPELQVVSLSGVIQALRVATGNLRDVVRLLAGILALLAAAVLLNATLLRTLAEHKRMFVLHAIGFGNRFIYGAAVIENVILVVVGATAGVALARSAGGLCSALLAGYLPYTPDGNLIEVGFLLGAGVLSIAVLVGVAATVPPLLRLRWFSGVGSFRGD